MDKAPYIKYRFSRRAIERLLGENRSTVAYHINYLFDKDVIDNKHRDRTAIFRMEAGRKVRRKIDVYDIYALRAIAHTFCTRRAESVVARCDEIIASNEKRSFMISKFFWID